MLDECTGVVDTEPMLSTLPTPVGVALPLIPSPMTLAGNAVGLAVAAGKQQVSK